MAPSQDITVSSNFERVLFWASGDNVEHIKTWMENLKTTGKFEVDSQTLVRLKDVFTSSRTSDREIGATQIAVWEQH